MAQLTGHTFAKMSIPSGTPVCVQQNNSENPIRLFIINIHDDEILFIGGKNVTPANGRRIAPLVFRALAIPAGEALYCLAQKTWVPILVSHSDSVREIEPPDVLDDDSVAFELGKGILRRVKTFLGKHSE